MAEKKNEVCAFRLAAAVCAVAVNPLFATPEYIGELSLIADTNAVIDVAEGGVAVVDVLDGSRGTVTKTGGGLLRILDVKNSKVRFEVRGGKVLFDRSEPYAFEKAFFHVDASRADTLVTEEENGTNFVVRWNDVRDNGRFATNCMYTAKWRPDPENRRAFISSVTQNGMPVVDFGEMLLNAYTNSLGESLGGYGATMIWNAGCTNAYEVYQVVSDTPDVALLKRRLIEAGISGEYRGVSFLSLSWGQASSRRANLKENVYPNILEHISLLSHN